MPGQWRQVIIQMRISLVPPSNLVMNFQCFPDWREWEKHVLGLSPPCYSWGWGLQQWSWVSSDPVHLSLCPRVHLCPWPAEDAKGRLSASSGGKQRHDWHRSPPFPPWHCKKPRACPAGRWNTKCTESGVGVRWESREEAVEKHLRCRLSECQEVAQQRGERRAGLGRAGSAAPAAPAHSVHSAAPGTRGSLGLCCQASSPAGISVSSHPLSLSFCPFVPLPVPHSAFNWGALVYPSGSTAYKQDVSLFPFSRVTLNHSGCR